MNNEYIKDLLRPIGTIFLKYVVGFFTILLILVSIGQYKEQGKLNLLDSVAFSFPIACIGAAIAAIFIGLFRKLDAMQPWVQASEYLEVDNGKLNRALSKIRKLRILIFAMFFLWIPYGLFVTGLNLPLIFVIAYMATMAVLSFVLYFSKCPRCEHYFFFRGARRGRRGDTGNERLNLLFSLGYRNALSGQCLNCGLKITNESSI